jgi:hypothetical protein
MKKKLFILLTIVAIIFIFFFFHKPGTPYSGTYYTKNTDVELVLNSDNSFDFYIANDKRDIAINGTYIINNNHIKLISNGKSDMFFIKDISYGIITGSVITFKDDKNNAITIFTKS